MRWRILTFGGLAVDDFLMAIVLPVTIAGTVASLMVEIGAKGLANSGMTPEERAALDPNSREFHLRVKGSQSHLAGWLLYSTLLWNLKLCWLFYYKRLGHRVEGMNLRVNIGLALCAVAYAVLMLTIIFGCWPFEKHWQINPDPGNSCHPASSKLQAWTMLATDCITDLYIISIPIPMIWHARISKINKIGLIIMFCGGLVTMTFSAIRCKFILENSIESSQIAAEWSDRESFVATIVTNVPVLFPLIRQKVWHIYDSSGYSRSRSRGHTRNDTKASRNAGNVIELSTIVAQSSSPAPGADINKTSSGSAFNFYQCSSEEAIVRPETEITTETEITSESSRPKRNRRF
ncbi:hypothetical protein CDD81_704 [Ophiocordyceps australis]|uniref:Rhodopsin domain-containing protein n=1 Tax=Ophiocordyceps australis TaxID=1399860 RepID=A0A2C5Y2S2_9HYPO|nr:hypothetical protein CDD81_704 [Ophiocordyceps australis]